MSNEEEMKNLLIRKELFVIINLSLEKYKSVDSVIDFLLRRAADLIKQLPPYEQQFYINSLRKQTSNS
jgi:hypothetical protein